MSSRVPILLVIVFATAVGVSGQVPAGPAERTFDFTYIARVQGIPGDATSLALWIPLPQDDPNQEIVVRRISSPYPARIATEPEFGNKMVHVTVAEPDRSSFEVALQFRVTRREWIRNDFGPAGTNGHDEPAPDPRWLEPDRLVPLDARIRGLAADVTRGKRTPVEKARAIYDYVVSTMRYDKSGTGWGKGDIYWACDFKRGNCTDFHALFTGLSRASGIPAKFVVGFPLPDDRASGRVEGYHCWAEFYLDGYGWVPVDTSEASKQPAKRDYFFGAHDAHRVQFTVGRDLVLAPPQQGEPINYFIYPYVEVDGQPFGAVEQEFRFADIE